MIKLKPKNVYSPEHLNCYCSSSLNTTAGVSQTALTLKHHSTVCLPSYRFSLLHTPYVTIQDGWPYLGLMGKNGCVDPGVYFSTPGLQLHPRRTNLEEIPQINTTCAERMAARPTGSVGPVSGDKWFDLGLWSLVSLENIPRPEQLE